MNANVVTINLSDRSITGSEVDASGWMGGRGLGVKLFAHECDAGCDPLGPDNVVVIAVSPLTGTAAPTAGRGHMVFKSPLTGGIGSANSGGHWGRALKAAGVDALVIKGAAAAPVQLTITGGDEPLSDRVKIESADDLWGMDVHQTTDRLLADHGKGARALVIGPAGENQVLFAAVMNEKNRAYGRGGPGAVFGAKNLKAIVAMGSAKTELADRDRFMLAVEQVRHTMKAQPVTKRVLKELGTAGLVHLIDMMGMLPRKNFKNCVHDEKLLAQISGEAIRDEILEKEGGCFGCPILCQRHTKVAGKTGEGPEYETAILMGANLDMYDLESLTLGSYAANELGLDTISLGGALCAAAELFESEVLSPADFGGESIQFADPEIYPAIVEKTASRDGLGALIALGSRRLSEKAGRPEAAMEVKGLELPAYDPRGMLAQALGYMTSPTGGCHLRGGYSVQLAFFGGIREVPRFSARQAPNTVKNQQDVGIIQDSLGVCRFTGFAVGSEHWARVVAAATGEDLGRAELEVAAERIACAERLFNLKAGLGRKDDDLPARFKEEPIIIGKTERVISDADRERMLDDYYHVRGWDREGVPTKETLDRLELGD